MLRHHPLLGHTLLWQRVDEKGQIVAQAELQKGPPAREMLERIQAHHARNPQVTAARPAAAASSSATDQLMLAPPPPVSLPALRSAGLGVFEGTLQDCAAPRKVQLSLRERPKQDFSDAVQVEGRISVADPANPSASPLFESNLTGILRSKTSMIALETAAAEPAPTPSGVAGLAAAARQLWNRRSSSGVDAGRIRHRNFRIDMARDVAGAGWVGLLNDTVFGCQEMVMKRTDGTRSDALRKLRIEEAFSLAEMSTAFLLEDDAVVAALKTSPVRPRRSLLGSANTPESQPWQGAVWLRLASDLGSPRAAALLGRAYEHGLGLPKDMQRAVAYYTDAARGGDPGGLRAMAQRFAAGDGVVRDEARGRGMVGNAERTVAQARRLCASEAAVEQFGALVLAQFRMQSNSLVNIALNAAMDQQRVVDIPALVVERVEPLAVSAPGAPFICKVTAPRVDARVTDLTPYRRWAHTDPHDNVTYYSDNEYDRAWNSMLADAQTKMLNLTPAIDFIEARSLGNNRWRLTFLDNDPAGALSRGVYVDIVAR